MTAPAKHTNRLARATSPYLLQHAHNPVEWYEWGEEALARARDEDKPILLSIGYSACHWCHVMERESFEDEATAELMNRDFVSIKVDREERPDLDEIYMAATQAMNQGQGGWPMTVFLTPDQEPFFAGTYFPPEDRWGRPGFKTLLRKLAELWQGDRPRLRAQAEEMTGYLRGHVKSAPATVGEDELRAAMQEMAADFDPRHGGFGGAPKFPPASALSLLLRCHRRFGDAQSLQMVWQTLDAMAQGGMYDQVGGGFHRYSVDERWLVPHFEKMLYDNAQLARAYLEGWQVTNEPFYRRIAAEVLDYALREMTSPEGGFYSATDADSEGEEGRFFVWTPAQVEEVLGAEDARAFCEYYDISEGGNWEGHSIPNTPRPLLEVARRLGQDAAELGRRLEASRAKLYEARKRRVPPALDDKVLTAWNGLMIGAMAEGARVLGEERWLAAARRAADFVLATHAGPGGRLLRTSRQGRAHIPGFLEDYAYFAQGLLDLYEAGGEERDLREATRLAERMVADFGDGGSDGFYSTARDAEALIVRHREGHDGATPAPNGVAAHVLARLSWHLDRDDLREAAVGAVRAWGKPLARHPRAFTTSLAVVDLLLDGPVELAFVQGPGLPELQREAGRHYLPNRIVAHHDPDGPASSLPLLAGRTRVGGKAALYVCRDYTCQLPVTDPAQVEPALAQSSGAARGGERASLSRRLPGAATAAGTAAYARRFAASGYAALGGSGLTASRVGFGGYRVDDETPPQREALLQALGSGCNLVDTSTNYTDGGSERLLGEVLVELARRGDVAREQVVVVSKIGYVQGANLALAQQREGAGKPFPEMVKYGEGLWHCIHPEFLEDQLARSLERLQLDTLDVCLLHNPEYFLSAAQQHGEGPLDEVRATFYARLRAAFAWFEAQVKAGRLGAYGVSSNTCTLPAGDGEFTSLTRMLQEARAAGGEGHHFQVLQLPLNLFESGALFERNNGPEEAQTVLEHAQANGVAVLANRPLNALVEGRIVRLAEVGVEGSAVNVDDQLRIVGGLEAEFRRQIAPLLQTAPGSVPAERLLSWGDDLQGVLFQVQGVEHWDQLEAQRILPRLLQVLRALDQALSGERGEEWQEWRARYVPEMQKLMGELRRQSAIKSAARTAALSAVLEPLLPAGRGEESLSRKALWAVASTPGISTVLVGMRRPEYVRDALGVLGWPPLDDVLPLYRRALEVRPRS